MRKALFIILGLLLVIGAIGVGSYRHLLQPEVARAPVSESLAPSTRGTRGVTAPDDTAAAPRAERGVERTQQRNQLGTWDMIDLVLNALNAVVGIIGIWLAIVGMRMQRAAAGSRAETVQINTQR